MSSPLSGFAESFRDAIRDVVLIVVSIVIAFAVDTWWDTRVEDQVKQAHLESLLGEFESARSGLTNSRGRLEASLVATNSILSLFSHPGEGVGPDSLAVLINSSFDVGAPAVEGGALRALLGSGRLAMVENPALAALLAGWPLTAEEIASNSELLIRNREEEVSDYLVSMGMPVSRIAANIDWIDLPPSAFTLDAGRLLADVGFESLLVSRSVRSQFLIRIFDSALEESDQIIRLLRQEIDG